MSARNSIRGADHSQELQAILQHAVHHTIAHIAIPMTNHRLLFLQAMGLHADKHGFGVGTWFFLLSARLFTAAHVAV